MFHRFSLFLKQAKSSENNSLVHFPPGVAIPGFGNALLFSKSERQKNLEYQLCLSIKNL